MAKRTVCVIGGGISGLHTAYELSKTSVSVTVLEARDRLGGRIYSPISGDDARYDLGPSWFWPGQQRIEALISELGLTDSVFQQFAVGEGLFESRDGTLQQGHGGFSMAGSLRLRDGLTTLIEALSDRIVANAGEDAIVLNSPVNEIHLNKAGITLATSTLPRQCDQVIVALPPRVACECISFRPIFEPNRINTLNSLATWMAGHAKAVMIFDHPFWRESGLSGDVISQLGPLSELHDASAFADQHYALFGFFGSPPSQRLVGNAQIQESIKAQLRRLFGPNSPAPRHILFKDWARDSFTATELDQNIPQHHPQNHFVNRAESGWCGRLIWSGSETDFGGYNGYIEGALSASYSALQLVQDAA